MSSIKNSPSHLSEPLDLPTPNNGESTSPHVETPVPPLDLHLTPQARSCARDQLSVPVHYEDPRGEITGHTKDLSPNGMGLVLSRFVKKGAPLSLQCSFGEICYLTISGQVRYCKEDLESHPGLFLIGVKFSALREWEQNILSSAIRELRENPETKARSFFKVTFAEDQLALEAARAVVHRRPQLPDIGHGTSKHCSKIVGWGSYLPDTEISNEEISARLLPLGYKNVGETIENLTGLKARRFASSERYPSDLAVLAAQDALRHAKIHPKDLDVIIFFGISRDFHEPATANVLQDKLGASKAYAYDLANACNGFVTAVDTLDSMIASGRCETGLVVTGELISPYIDWSPKTKKDLKLSMFGYTIGDAGGAAVLTK
ncbi:MAG: PilZ domain-containing protein, partial [Nitrospirales bacterium]